MGRNLIRRAVIEDRGFIEAIYKQHKNQLGSFNLFYSWDRYFVGKGVFLVVPGKAFVRYGWSTKYQANVVYEIGVLEEFHGYGLGSLLMRQVPTPILLKCNKDNEANKFYKAIGMKKAGETTTRNGRPQNIWVCAGW